MMSIGEYTAVFLPGEAPSLREAWQATVYRVAESDTSGVALHAQAQGFSHR